MLGMVYMICSDLRIPLSNRKSKALNKQKILNKQNTGGVFFLLIIIPEEPFLRKICHITNRFINMQKLICILLYCVQFDIELH